MATDFFTTLNTVKKVLALDFACKESDFDNEGVSLYPARELPGRRRFPFRQQSLGVATMGRGVVVSCSAARMRWAKINLSGLSRNDLYDPYIIGRMAGYVKRDGQQMAGPDLKFVCAPDIFNPFFRHDKTEITLVGEAELFKMVGDSRFPNSLGFGYNSERPWTVGALARCDNELVGMAVATADCDEMWQIGVDTLPEYRKRGIGKATVSAVSKYILKQGIVPYYSTTMDNEASKSIALALGYKPAWVELYSREPKTEGGQ
ncbi:MAG: GNAT family N-acetyltransferase [Dehalococcoidales bacterium]|jgi:GNAT superfamily N-acetyltransferase